MLTRFRIEVEGADSAADCEAELDRYEHALKLSERRRYSPGDESEVGHLNDFLGRHVTDEVIEYDEGLPGHRGRRVVQLRRIDTRDPQRITTGPDRTGNPEGRVTSALGTVPVTTHRAEGQTA